MTQEEFEKRVVALAEEFARSADGLDFSPGSLAGLDEIIVKLRDSQAELGAQAVVESTQAAGAYLAQVVIRRAPVTLRWVDAKRVNPAWDDARNPYLLATPKNLVFAVLGKPLRLLVEKDETARGFADKIQDLCSREAMSGG